MTAQKLANQYFREYTLLAALNPEKMFEDRRRWESKSIDELLVMTLEKQAEFADPVTRQMCNKSQDVIREFCHTDDGDDFYFYRSQVTIGNVALIIRSLPDCVERQHTILNHKRLTRNTILLLAFKWYCYIVAVSIGLWIVLNPRRVYE